jgi:cell division protein ZapE
MAAKEISSGIILDTEQEKAWHEFQQLIFKINSHKKRLKINTTGIYLWGPVGRGKTMLVNEFYNALITQYKIRMHFQNFMKYVHEKLTSLMGEKNCMKKLADRLVEHYDVICLDDFYVDDIANATIMSNLFKELYHRKLVLVITANTSPDDLCNSMLIKERFHVANQLLKKHNKIIRIDNQKDYRLSFKGNDSVFFWGDEAITNAKLSQFFFANSGKHPEAGKVHISHHLFHYKAKYKNIIWFDFAELCDKPRSQLDYINLAAQFNILLISHIPQLEDNAEKTDKLETTFFNNRTKRFITLIDEMYDKNILLVANFKCPLNALYLGHELKFQFERTYSRLNEMQSAEYLKKTAC